MKQFHLEKLVGKRKRDRKFSMQLNCVCFLFYLNRKRKQDSDEANQTRKKKKLFEQKNILVTNYFTPIAVYSEKCSILSSMKSEWKIIDCMVLCLTICYDVSPLLHPVYRKHYALFILFIQMFCDVEYRCAASVFLLSLSSACISCV